MVETWRDSWFEDGARLFYLFPISRRCRSSAADGAQAGDVARVFVGRMEIVTPEIESEVAEAIRTNNQAVLRKYGRFLEPISQMVQQRLATRCDQQKVDSAMKLVASQSTKAAAPRRLPRGRVGPHPTNDIRRRASARAIVVRQSGGCARAHAREREPTRQYPADVQSRRLWRHRRWRDDRRRRAP